MADNDNVQTGLVERQEFGAMQTSRPDAGVAALVAQQTAEIQARCVLALERPRDWMAARGNLLTECRRTGFAETARYSRPVGKKKDHNGNWVDQFASGFSIRFAEAAIRSARNIDVSTMVVSDDDRARVIVVAVLDLESNVRTASTITAAKIVERRFLKRGQTAKYERLNSQGDKVFGVDATEDEVAVRAAAMVSKAIRTAALRLIPGDILEDCERECAATLQKADAQDPAAAIKRLADAFGAMSVSVEALTKHLGHPLAETSPAERDRLRTLWAAIRDGETTWREVVADDEAASAAPAEGAARPGTLEAVKEAARKAKEEAAATTAPPVEKPKRGKAPKTCATCGGGGLPGGCLECSTDAGPTPGMTYVDETGKKE